MRFVASIAAACLATVPVLPAQGSADELLRQAGRALQANETAQAVRLLEQAVELDSEDPEPVAQLLEALLAAGDVQAGMTLAVQAQQRFPDHVGVQYWFGVGAHFLGAEPFLRLALRNLDDVNPEDPRTAVLRSLLSLARHEPREAVAGLERAGAPMARVFLATALLQLGDAAAAERALRETAEPRFEGRRQLALGQALAAQGRASEAIEALRAAERSMPASVEVQLELARLLEATGDQAGAAERRARAERLRRAEP